MIKKLSSFFCKHILGRVTISYELSAISYELPLAALRGIETFPDPKW